MLLPSVFEIGYRHLTEPRRYSIALRRELGDKPVTQPALKNQAWLAVFQVNSYFDLFSPSKFTIHHISNKGQFLSVARSVELLTLTNSTK